MGTSASGSGAGNNNPLIPSWIGGGAPPPEPPPPPPPPEPEPPDHDDNDNAENNNSPDKKTEAEEIQVDNNNENNANAGINPQRFTTPRRDFNKFIASGGSNTGALKKALKEYSKRAAGSTSGLARRMRPSTLRVTSFFNAINTVKEKGKTVALAEFNLSHYQDRPLIEILSSLSDEIFKDTGQIYEDTQDDSITKQAYSNTVVRICELEGIDLDTLTNEQVEVMLAIFIEETIAQRVICDIGNKFTEKNPDLEQLLQMEENIYQIVSGLVRNKIMPEIIATQIGDKRNIEEKIENIYRQAFDAIKDSNN